MKRILLSPAFLRDTLIPLVLIIGAFTLIAFGIDGEVKTVLMLAAGWAFRAQYTRHSIAKRKKR